MGLEGNEPSGFAPRSPGVRYGSWRSVLRAPVCTTSFRCEETGIHYSPACHRQPPFDDGGADRCPVASAWAAEELSLPMFEHLGDTEIDRVAAACKSAVAA